MMVAPFLSRDRDRDLRRTSSASRVSTASPHATLVSTEVRNTTASVAGM